LVSALNNNNNAQEQIMKIIFTADHHVGVNGTGVLVKKGETREVDAKYGADLVREGWAAEASPIAGADGAAIPRAKDGRNPGDGQK
jgi:hypothetical protein